MAETFVMLDVDKFQKDSVMLDVLPSILCSLSDLVRAFRRASNPLAAYIMPAAMAGSASSPVPNQSSWLVAGTRSNYRKGLMVQLFEMFSP